MKNRINVRVRITVLMGSRNEAFISFSLLWAGDRAVLLSRATSQTG